MSLSLGDAIPRSYERWLAPSLRALACTDLLNVVIRSLSLLDADSILSLLWCRLNFESGSLGLLGLLGHLLAD